MPIPRSAACTVLVGTMVLGVSVVSGQSYPNRPIRIITSGIGGSADIVARLIAQGITAPLAQQVIVENRPSGISQEVAAKAPPDGYTLLLTSPSHWLLPLMRTNVPYDPVRDFSPITVATVSPNVLLVHPSLPARSVKELIALGKARPGVLNYGIVGTGSSSHLAAELFKAMSGIDMVRINYKSTATKLSDLLGGQLHLTFNTVVSVEPHIKSGRLRGLAVSGAQPSMVLPELPTVAAAGLPGYESVSTLCIFGPAGTPASIVNRLNQEIVRFLNLADTKARLLSTGAEIVGSSPDQLTSTMRADVARMTKVIKNVGIKAD